MANESRVPFYSGDDVAAKAEIRKLIEDTGALAAHNFVKI